MNNKHTYCTYDAHSCIYIFMYACTSTYQHVVINNCTSHTTYKTPTVNNDLSYFSRSIDSGRYKMECCIEQQLLADISGAKY